MIFLQELFVHDLVQFKKVYMLLYAHTLPRFNLVICGSKIIRLIRHKRKQRHKDLLPIAGSRSLAVANYVM